MRPGVWRLRVFAGRRPNGSPIQLCKTIVSREARERGERARPGSGIQEAKAELALLRAKASSGDATAGTTTVGELLDRWLAHCESLGRSPTTMRGYRDIANRVVRPELGKVRLGKLTAQQLDGLYAKLTAKGNKATTVRRVHALIGASLHQAEKWSLVERNVARLASPPPVHRQRVEAPTPGQVHAIVTAAEAIEPTLATALLLGALTGCRRGELCALRWSDLDTDAAILTVGRSVYETAGGGWAEKSTKTHQLRRIGLDELAMEALRRHQAAVEQLADQLGLAVLPDAFMFSRSPVGAEPIRPDVLTKFTIRAAKAAGVGHVHLHQLRHFSATQAIGAGFDPVTVASRLGHADPSITLNVYAHAIEQRDRDVAAALGSALAAARDRPALDA